MKLKTRTVRVLLKRHGPPDRKPGKEVFLVGAVLRMPSGPLDNVWTSVTAGYAGMIVG